jgi:molybdenum cofactor cytidylyltransferase
MHKLHAPLVGKTVLEHTLSAVQASGLPWKLYDQATPGMGHSIAEAVTASRSACGWLILPADLPLVRPQTLVGVAAALLHSTVVVPTWQGQRGHPVGFSKECGERLMALVGDKGAAAVVRYFGANLLEVDDPGIALDIDTVHDLQLAEGMLLR